jgi:hypothetical protein
LNAATGHTIVDAVVVVVLSRFVSQQVNLSKNAARHVA